MILGKCMRNVTEFESALLIQIDCNKFVLFGRPHHSHRCMFWYLLYSIWCILSLITYSSLSHICCLLVSQLLHCDAFAYLFLCCLLYAEYEEKANKRGTKSNSLPYHTTYCQSILWNNTRLIGAFVIPNALLFLYKNSFGVISIQQSRIYFVIILNYECFSWKFRNCNIN